MPTKPGDNKLRSARDRVILDRYRAKIDPDRRGVARSGFAFYMGFTPGWPERFVCCVCCGVVHAADSREFYLKPYSQPVDLDLVKGVCGQCARKAWEEHRADQTG